MRKDVNKEEVEENHMDVYEELDKAIRDADKEMTRADELEQEVETLLADRDRQAEVLKKNLVSINELTAKESELEKEILDMRKDYAAVCKKLESHGLTLYFSDDGLEVLVTEDTRERIMDLEGECDTLQAEVANLREKLERITGERDRAINDANQQRQNYVDLQEEYSKIAETKDDIFQKEFDNPVSTLKMGNLELKKKLEEEVQHHADVKNVSTESLYGILIRELKNQVASQKEIIDKREDTITRLEDTVALQEAELADGTDTDSVHLETIMNLSEDYSAAQLDLRVYRLAIREYVKQLSHMKNERDEAIISRDATRQDLSETSKRGNKVRMQLRDALRERDEARAEIERLKEAQ